MCFSRQFSLSSSTPLSTIIPWTFYHWFSFVLNHHLNGIRQHLCFCAWLLLVYLMSLRFIYAFHMVNVFFFSLQWAVFHLADSLFFVDVCLNFYSSINLAQTSAFVNTCFCFYWVITWAWPFSLIPKVLHNWLPEMTSWPGDQGVWPFPGAQIFVIY